MNRRESCGEDRCERQMRSFFGYKHCTWDSIDSKGILWVFRTDGSSGRR